jgi:hypothetical protein
VSHTCPRRGCRVVVPDHLFACRQDWFALSRPVQAAIYATAGQHLANRDRIDAIKAAREEWQQLDQAAES